MSSAAPPDYALERTPLSSARLDLQHYNWISALGYHLHPSLPPADEPLCIADIGTGSGLWACEVSRQRPSSTVYGFDIDLGQCPPKDWLPSNVKMEKLDMFGTMPSHLCGKFDIVHLRHFQVVTPKPQVPLQNMIKLLKPGGWLQWSEYDLSNRHVVKTGPEMPEEKQQQLMQYAEELKPPQIRDDTIWVHRLRQILTDEGLEMGAVDLRRPPPWFRGQQWVVGLWSYREMSLRLPEDKGNKLRTFVKEAEDEYMNSGKSLAVVCDLATYVARKPGSSSRVQ